MHTLSELYRIGRGPSSSHTMGPFVAAARFLKKYPNASSFRVTLYGSLAATGSWHGTDEAIRESLSGYIVEFKWNPFEELPLHTNGMRLEALNESGDVFGSMDDYSVGGGALLSDVSIKIYPVETISEILDHCERSGENFWDYVVRYEGDSIRTYLAQIWLAMVESIERGLN